ncbi:hypothetical protein ACTXT7_013587 [Hymenolepis weldensis]
MLIKRCFYIQKKLELYGELGQICGHLMHLSVIYLYRYPLIKSPSGLPFSLFWYSKVGLKLEYLMKVLLASKGEGFFTEVDCKSFQRE